MSSLKEVFAVLEQMRDHVVVTAYTIGGATAGSSDYLLHWAIQHQR